MRQRGWPSPECSPSRTMSGTPAALPGPSPTSCGNRTSTPNSSTCTPERRKLAMRNAANSLRKRWHDIELLDLSLTALAQQETRPQASQSPNEFVELCFTDTLGRRLRQGQVHRDLQEFLGRHARALIELPRDHGKSLQVCIRVLWELGHDPSLRVKIVCASHAMAVERCRFLREAISHNPLVRLVFPDLRHAQPWGTTRFTIRRPADVIGPTLTAVGVGSVSTGSRADLLICDDIVDVKALRSRADRERVKAFFHENLMNLLEPDGRFWGLFTPWHKDDLNSDLKTNPAYTLFRRAVEPMSGEQTAESGEPNTHGEDHAGSPHSALRSPLEEWQPVWPEKW